MADNFLTQYYTDNHWLQLAQNQRDWYVPQLLQVWRDQAIYRPFVPISVDLQAQKTKKMIWTMVYDLEPNSDAVSWHTKWVESMVTSSAQLEITTEHHMGKILLDDQNDYYTYWQQNGAAGLSPIIRNLLAPAATTHMDVLARNAFLDLHFKSYAMGGATNFSDLADGDIFDLDWALDVQLRGMTQNLPGFNNQMGTIACITTPGTIYAINKDAAWISLNQYTDAGLQRLFTGEIGSYKGMRFIVTNKNILWNCGAIDVQKKVTAAAVAGQGAAAWATYKPDNTNFPAHIQLEDFDAADFAVNDVVTIHTVRSDQDGVTDGVQWRSGKTASRIVKSVNATTNRLGFDRPLLQDYDEDLDAPNGTYAYVTKARNVHASVFILAPGAVVAGVTKPLSLIIPPSIDDAMATQRFVYDTYTKYQLFRPELAEVVFHSGQHRVAAGAPAF